MNNSDITITDRKPLEELAAELTFMLMEIENKLDPISRRLEKVSDIGPLMIDTHHKFEKLSEDIVEQVDEKSIKGIYEAIKKVADKVSSLETMVTVSAQDVTVKYEQTLLRLLEHHVDVWRKFDHKVNSRINEVFAYINVKRLEKEIKEKIIDSLESTSRNELRNIDGFKKLSQKLEKQQELYTEHVEEMIKVNERFENNLQTYGTSFKYAAPAYILVGIFTGITLSYYFFG